jgi:hypothetical protein
MEFYKYTLDLNFWNLLGNIFSSTINFNSNGCNWVDMSKLRIDMWKCLLNHP